MYVGDLAEVLVRLLSYTREFDIYNVGAGRSYSVKEIIDIIQAEFSVNKGIIEKYNERKNEIKDCAADIRHLEGIIGKLEITSLTDGIHKWHIGDKK